VPRQALSADQLASQSLFDTHAHAPAADDSKRARASDVDDDGSNAGSKHARAAAAVAPRAVVNVRAQAAVAAAAPVVAKTHQTRAYRRVIALPSNVVLDPALEQVRVAVIFCRSVRDRELTVQKIITFARDTTLRDALAAGADTGSSTSTSAMV
jgi:hypothetical protein